MIIAVGHPVVMMVVTVVAVAPRVVVVFTMIMSAVIILAMMIVIVADVEIATIVLVIGVMTTLPAELTATRLDVMIGIVGGMRDVPPEMLAMLATVIAMLDIPAAVPVSLQFLLPLVAKVVGPTEAALTVTKPVAMNVVTGDRLFRPIGGRLPCSFFFLVFLIGYSFLPLTFTISKSLPLYSLISCFVPYGAHSFALFGESGLVLEEETYFLFSCVFRLGLIRRSERDWGRKEGSV